MGCPSEIEPMMSSASISICAKCQIPIRPGVGKVRLLYWLAKWGRCGQVVVESLQWAWECVILWEVLQIRPTKYGRLSKNTLWRETSYASSCPSQKPSNKSFSSCLPRFWCRMWKLETPKSWIDGIWLECRDEIGTFLGSNLHSYESNFFFKVSGFVFELSKSN